MSSARAIGAAGAGVPMLLIAEHGPNPEGLSALPIDHVTRIFLYSAAGLLGICLILTLLLNPYPIVKEPKDPLDATFGRSRPQRGAEAKRGNIEF